MANTGVISMFKVGDKIVYPMHGVGQIDGIEKKVVLGKRNEYYMITIINNGMKVMIPVNNAKEIGIRSIIPKKDIKKVLGILSVAAESIEEDWKLRYQNNIDKVKSGSIYEVAEVARDLFKRGNEKELSIMERKLYENAYQLITYEVAMAKSIDIDDAGNVVSEALASGFKDEE
ncbi:MAG TPA: CarD family transcriptional regulator [Spirochaetota bacterium]|nr:CarD family transcriptional regulator [Spirochaetota bacterium]HPF05578.1 CarD family transcriptional regulator [Spirochaetota bacterium]HPJ41541.1 CarD family transcriptional regulator [Spirochaetota bacterium]HPR36903.1 CarD family transcriptional regulator [Spirochaetota bacterium]HRX47399.1 CarD family transcriptional regulator [Spirochaetota bacterium]